MQERHRRRCGCVSRVAARARRAAWAIAASAPRRAARRVDGLLRGERLGRGVGTVYRRFGDKRALLAALVGEDERRLQEAILAPDPPLGHDAPPRERLEAFVLALADVTERNLNALLATDATPAERLHIGAYGAWRVHLAHLLTQVDGSRDARDAAWLADLMLAALDPSLYAQQRRERRMSAGRIARNLAAAVRLAGGRG